jgi:hypothetical protein
VWPLFDQGHQAPPAPTRFGVLALVIGPAPLDPSNNKHTLPPAMHILACSPCRRCAQPARPSHPNAESIPPAPIWPPGAPSRPRPHLICAESLRVPTLVSPPLLPNPRLCPRRIWQQLNSAAAAARRSEIPAPPTSQLSSHHKLVPGKKRKLESGHFSRLQLHLA